ncbi:hypothetical protein SAMN05421810_106172 [Amycolatopsis arida]|uniref:Esterase-like activity of phytase n=1 Tax=Amycolatopsis arida TaxID=587909 RepID=A0A1I5XN96_9PSEU|nr:hypothetical protein CLV69_102449 [Amycolatopsis arida]SFQ33455.1 hypothetical protein SAMN05421810_106172 [Amycolatopsis arida]
MLSVLLAVLLVGSPALAAPAEVPAPEPVCAIDDQRIGELSGMAADGGHRYAVNDGGRRIQVFVLDRSCRVQRVLTNSTDPYDVEDLALATDGTLWLADTGDNRKQRDTVALHAVRSDGRATLYRLTYPDGQHDAEALLLDRAGTPYLVTKNVLGRSEVYRPAERLTSPGPTPLEKVGSLSLSATDTPGGPVGPTGSVLVTGGAVSADGTVVALRTYTDAYLYPAPDGDVVAALGRQPVRVPLPDEPQGEAIAFEPDGTLLSASEGVGQPVRAVPGAAGLVGEAGTDGPNAGRPGGEPPADSRAADPAGEESMPVLPAVAVVVALAAAALGLNKLRRQRHRRPGR